MRSRMLSRRRAGRGRTRFHRNPTSRCSPRSLIRIRTAGHPFPRCFWKDVGPIWCMRNRTARLPNATTCACGLGRQPIEARLCGWALERTMSASRFAGERSASRTRFMGISIRSGRRSFSIWRRRIGSIRLRSLIAAMRSATDKTEQATTSKLTGASLSLNCNRLTQKTRLKPKRRMSPRRSTNRWHALTRGRSHRSACGKHPFSPPGSVRSYIASEKPHRWHTNVPILRGPVAVRS